MKQLIKTILKNKSYAIINVTGLALGIACALIFFLLVTYLTNIDNYHTNKERIYRVVTKSKNNGRDDYNSGVPVPLINALENDFPEFEIVAPVYYIISGRITIGSGTSQRVYEEDQGLAYCDDRLYRVLDRDWLRGDKESSLTGPNQVVLTESWALKYFESLDILGEPLHIEGIGDVIVTGVTEDYPEGRTDFPFEMLISYSTVRKELEKNHGWHSNMSDFQCYVLLKEGESIRTLEERLLSFADKYYGEDRNDSRTHIFQPLSDLHFNENYSNYRYKTVSRGNILVMILLGVFLIAIACINFINLSTAQASTRFKEVGIRKVLGSTRHSIIIRFLEETVLITFLAIVIALGLTELSLLKVNQLLDLNLSLDILRNAGIWIFLIVVLILVTLGAGLYPGIVISRFQPSSALRGGKVHSKGIWRKSLVIFQFIISQILIIGTLIIISQVNFYKNAAVGFNKENIINIMLPDNKIFKTETFGSMLHQIPSVTEVSFSWKPPASGSVSTTNVYFNFENQRKELYAQVKMGDESYIDVYGLDLLAGEGLVKSDTIDRAVVNESFTKRMGYQNPLEAVGSIINIWGIEIPISGVVADFHTMSFRRKIEPVVIYADPSKYKTGSVKIQGADIPESLKRIEEAYSKIFTGYSFNYSFMDESFANFYRNEEQMAKMLTTFACIALFIACMGLYGFVSFVATNRTKEIGIRKVLGATPNSVVFNFSKEFALLILMAFLIALPLAYYGMDSWLNQFAYHTALHPGIFLAAIGFNLLIAFMTIAYKSIRASLINPVEALKEE